MTRPRALRTSPSCAGAGECFIIALDAEEANKRAQIYTWTAAHRTYVMQISDEGPVQLFDEGKSRMSSLSRRACYKCGNVGHYAEVCSSSERLCYNCKQPGEHRVFVRLKPC